MNIFAFNIPPNMLAEAKAWLSERMPLLPRDGEDQFRFQEWNADAIYFRDVAGNIVEFIARHNLPEGVSGPFAATDLLSVCEIGLVVPEVPALVSGIRDALEVPIYLNESDTFTTLGDERGLFIVVREGRPWFPTDTPARGAATEVVIQGAPGFHYVHRALGYDIRTEAR